MKKILSFIPARGNSKGIPLKNLAELNGKSLLHYTINASLNSELITRTIVSTDNKKIKSESIRLGAEVVDRPKKLAGDKIGIEPSVQYTLDLLRKKENYVPDVIIVLSNTHPFRTSLHIDDALSLLFKKKYDSVLSGYEIHTFFWKQQSNSAIVPLNYDPQKRPNRQDIEIPLFENGALFASTYSAFIKSKCRISGKIGFYKMSLDTSYNIDTKNDLIDAEKLMQKQNPKNIFSVKNKNIVITGSSGLLGNYYATILAEQGANLALIDIDTKNSEKIKKIFNVNSQKIKIYKCDLSKPKEISNTFKKIQLDFEFLDVLINNAAFGSKDTFHIKDFKNYEKHPFELWKKAFQVNTDAVHLCTQNALSMMKKRKSGSIINISSNYGIVGPSFETYENEDLWTPPGYAVTKGAIINFSRYIANLYGKDNIRCNTFSPSGVQTKMLSKKFVKKYASNNAFGRMASPQDYAGPILFLCSDASMYMTGANLVVDGGWTAK
mgnify:FL=1